MRQSFNSQPIILLPHHTKLDSLLQVWQWASCWGKSKKEGIGEAETRHADRCKWAQLPQLYIPLLTLLTSLGFLRFCSSILLNFLWHSVCLLSSSPWQPQQSPLPILQAPLQKFWNPCSNPWGPFLSISMVRISRSLVRGCCFRGTFCKLAADPAVYAYHLSYASIQERLNAGGNATFKGVLLTCQGSPLTSGIPQGSVGWKVDKDPCMGNNIFVRWDHCICILLNLHLAALHYFLSLFVILSCLENRSKALFEWWSECNVVTTNIPYGCYVLQTTHYVTGSWSRSSRYSKLCAAFPQ